jgi:uncharacterized protein YggE
MKKIILMAAAVMMYGCVQNNEKSSQSTVTVSGTGTVYVEPDMVRMTVFLNETARTTRQAQEAVGKMAGMVLEILKESGIEDKDITTASLTFNPEYEWRGNRSVLIGQCAEQGIEFAVRDIRRNNEKVAGIIDRLVGIDCIMLNSINFSVDDNTEHFVRSRELAFEKAVQKAKQYAELSGLKAGRVLSLSEDGINDPSPLYGNRMVNRFELEKAAVMADVATVLPSGQLEVTTRISAVFLLE